MFTNWFHSLCLYSVLYSLATTQRKQSPPCKRVWNTKHFKKSQNSGNAFVAATVTHGRQWVAQEGKEVWVVKLDKIMSSIRFFLMAMCLTVHKLISFSLSIFHPLPLVPTQPFCQSNTLDVPFFCQPLHTVPLKLQAFSLVECIFITRALLSDK